jgi:3-oxoacyl-[acyl-carrier-protein] synthase-3
MIIVASITAEYKSPNVACMIQKKLGATCPAMDINCACSAFVFALETAAGYFARGKVQRMLVVGAERLSATVDWQHRSTCVIFGDGAGAVLLEKGGNYLSSRLHSYGDNDIIRIPNYAGDSPFYKGPIEKPVINMHGQETFQFAVKSICRDIQDVAADAGIQVSDISWVVPHQANSRIIDYAKKKLPIPGDRFYLNIERYGNTSSASIPIALDELNRKGCFKRGELLALCAFGGGLSSAACIIRW